MKRILLCALLVTLIVLGHAASTATAKPKGGQPAQSYLVIGKTDHLPRNSLVQIHKSGGQVVSSIPELGVLVVESADPNFARKADRIAGIQAVVPNFQMQWVEQQQVEAASIVDADSLVQPADDYHFELQWALQAISAPAAWAQGHFGQGVLVAVLDTGFDLEHPDLKDNIDLGRSRNFVEGQSLEYSLPDMFSHGTHVAGIIAAADNGIGTIGVAPQASLMLVKVLQDNGSGKIEDILKGITYAADQGAKVINMSFAAQFDTNGFYYYVSEPGKGEWLPMPKKDILEYRRLMGRAVTYANSRGALVVAAAGNDGWFRPNGSSILILPADAQNAIGVSATAPIRWRLNVQDGKAVSFDYLAQYSNYGPNLVDIAAPGGDYRFKHVEPQCTFAGQTQSCWVFDMVISTGYTRDGEPPAYYWTAGTSMAAAHTSGVLALLVGKNNGKISTGQATTRLSQSADDLGPAGKDMYFGSGRINAGQIVK
jgi:lantibiotic leader peptide-processing serine protease